MKMWALALKVELVLNRSRHSDVDGNGKIMGKILDVPAISASNITLGGQNYQRTMICCSLFHVLAAKMYSDSISI